MEIEIKYFLPNYDAVKEYLDKHAKIDKIDVMQRDRYFMPAHEDYTWWETIDKRLRVRVTEHWSSVTFKHRHDNKNKGSFSCDDFETSIGNAEVFEAIFEKIGVKELITLDKKRTTYLYKQAEIALDFVAELGWFVEIESKWSFATIDSAQRHLFEVAQEIWVSKNKQDKRGYPYHLLEKAGKI